MSFVTIIGALLCTTATNYLTFTFYMFILGISIGMITPLAFVIVCEVFPIDNRGSAITLLMCGWAVGEMFMILVCLYILEDF